jgi:hypothetical protein
MSSPIRSALAFRWQSTFPTPHRDDFVRLRETNGGVLALVANGFECGFSVFWPPASRLILELFEQAWESTTGSTEQRLEQSFARACELFTQQARGLLAPDCDFPDDTPAATLLAVATAGRTAYARWIGGEVAVQARGGQVVSVTAPHTLHAHYADQPLDKSTVPNALVRVIQQEPSGLAAPSTARFELLPGDTLMLMNHVYSAVSVSPETAARAAAGFSDPSALAEHLADLVVTDLEEPYAAVICLRCEAPTG